jgi:hypothetical protein
MIKVDASVFTLSMKNFPIGLHVMYLYFTDTPRNSSVLSFILTNFTYIVLIYLNRWRILPIYFAYFLTDKFDCLLCNLSFMSWDTQNSLVVMSAFELLQGLTLSSI